MHKKPNTTSFLVVVESPGNLDLLLQDQLQKIQNKKSIIIFKKASKINILI